MIFQKKNYLKIPTKTINESKKNLEQYTKKFKIGLSWKSFNTLYSNQKSLNLFDFDYLINSNDFDFINLQYGNVSK